MHELNHLINLGGQIFHNIWSYDLITVSGKQIRIGNIVFAIILFFIGLKYSKKFSQIVKYYVKTKLSLDKDAANALEKIISYAALSLFIVLILEITNVPLSAFAFVGGASAIGIGFAAQSLIANFIGSLVIMLERPLKIGDIIEIEGIIGTVNSVGARCVTLTTFANVDVLVPNSKLIQNTLINWTLNDSLIRCQIELKIPRKRKVDLKLTTFINELEEFLMQLDIVCKRHEPEVSLNKIQQDSLTFLLNFYCNLQLMENLEHIKGILNLALFEYLHDNDFTVEYFKVVNVKASGKDEK